MDEPQAIKFSYTDSIHNTSLSPLPILYYFNYYYLPPCYFFIILQSLLLPSSVTLLHSMDMVHEDSLLLFIHHQVSEIQNSWQCLRCSRGVNVRHQIVRLSHPSPSVTSSCFP